MRLWLTVGGLVTFAIAGFATIWWFFAISLGEQQLVRAEKRLSERGYELRYQRLEQKGFPLNLVWVLHGVSLTRVQSGEARPRLEGVADAVRVQARPWSPQSLQFAVVGKHQWLSDTQGAAGAVTTIIGSAAGEIGPRDAAPGWRLSATLTGIEARSESLQTAPLTMSRLSVAGQLPLSMDALQLQVDLTDIHFPQDTGLGSVLQSASLNTDVEPLPHNFDAAALRTWQGAGGKVTVNDLHIAFGSLQGSANGAVGLDQDLRGQGSITVRMREPQRFVTAATEAGWIQAKQQPLLALGLGLFSAKGNSGKTEAAIPLDLRGGGLWLGPLQLATLPPIAQ